MTRGKRLHRESVAKSHSRGKKTTRESVREMRTTRARDDADEEKRRYRDSTRVEDGVVECADHGAFASWRALDFQSRNETTRQTRQKKHRRQR